MHGSHRGGGKGSSGGRYRRKRPLGHGDLRLLLLSLISEKPSHGYDLIRAVAEKTGGAYEPSPGVIYPALEMLLDMGWTRVETAEGRKTFHITDEGTAALAEDAEKVAAIQARLSELAEREILSDPEDVRGAMRLLRHELMAQVKSKGGEGRKAEMVDIINQAREAVNKLS